MYVLFRPTQAVLVYMAALQRLIDDPHWPGEAMDLSTYRQSSVSHMTLAWLRIGHSTHYVLLRLLSGYIVAMKEIVILSQME